MVVTCPECGARGKVRNPYPGKRVECRQCGAPIVVPGGVRRPSPAPAPADSLEEWPLADSPPGDANDADLGGDAFAPAAPGPALDDDKQLARIRRRTMVPAGFWRRAAALLLDTLVMGCVTGCIGGVVGGVMGFSIGAERGGPLTEDDLAGIMAVNNILGNVVGLVGSWLYWALMESSEKHATLGKMALGIIVVDDRGAPLTFLRASLRHWAKMLSGCLCLAGYFMAAFTEHKQGLHDLIAGCYVIQRESWAEE